MVYMLCACSFMLMLMYAGAVMVFNIPQFVNLLGLQVSFTGVVVLQLFIKKTNTGIYAHK